MVSKAIFKAILKPKLFLQNWGPGMYHQSVEGLVAALIEYPDEAGALPERSRADTLHFSKVLPKKEIDIKIPQVTQYSLHL